MPGWTTRSDRTFQRPLDPTELIFFWSGHFNGTADFVQHVELRLSNPSRDANLFVDANIAGAWLSTKRRYPLAGAAIQALASGPHFVVREDDLDVLRPHEIVFDQVACAEEVSRRIAAIWDGPRSLSDQLLTKLYVFRESTSQSERTIALDVLHLVILMSHAVADGMAKWTFIRSLVDTLSRGGAELPAQIPLEERLSMAIPSVDLEPIHLRLLSPARRRWRRAIATVIFRLRMEKSKGGHTLPCRLTRTTQDTPARPCFLATVLTEAQTTTVLGHCRLHEITFGCAFLVLAQVAMTRVLYRRYLRGDISQEEWEHRKRQPYRTLGPLNLRPYLDKEWFAKGGGGEFMLSIHVHPYDLPFMTLGETERCLEWQRHGRDLSDGTAAPAFSDLLTFDRFLHRAKSAKKHAKAFYGHPLFFEFMYVTYEYYANHMRSCALRWAEASDEMVRNGNGNDTSVIGSRGSLPVSEVLAATDIPSIIAHGGSSFGNLHLIFPTEYPLPPAHPLSPFSPTPHPSRAGYITPPPSLSSEVDATPRVVVQNIETQLHARPAELYLGAVTGLGRLTMHTHYDRNVYEDGVVKEWLDEVKGAVLWYLGQTHRSRYDRVRSEMHG